MKFTNAVVWIHLLHLYHVSAQHVLDLSNNQWTLQNLPLDISVPATFPSYVHLDLYANQIIGNPEYGLNDFNLRWIWKENWTYTAVITGLDSISDHTILLFQGLDTFATIELCGQHVGYTNNQFRQWHFEVTDALLSCTDDVDLSIDFGSAPKIAEAIANEPGQEEWVFGIQNLYEIHHREFIRKEQNDFGWDWGPAFAPAGPWLPAYVIQMNQSHIYPRNVLIDIYKKGQQSNRIPDQIQPWVLNASIDYIGNLPKDASLTYTLKDFRNSTILDGALQSVNQTNSTVTGMVEIENGAVELWWPIGMGSQILYFVTVEVKDGSNNTIASVVRRVGFRTIVRNAEVVSEEQIAMGIAPGNNFHFEINGQSFFAKGSNFIPPDIFWPRVTPESIGTLFRAVADGNQNMLRVWSSGAYSPDFIYDIADEMGILLWSEFEFGCALYPVSQEFLDNIYEEAVYQVRRVNHHPSLAYWAGGNEMENLELALAEELSLEEFPRLKTEYERLFLSVLFPAVFENSRSISYSPSSTTNGFKSVNFTEAPYMEERYEDLTPGHIYQVTDYYNYNAAMAFNNSVYPIGRFANEFGYHSMPSLQTWQDYVPESELYFNSSTILLRNRAPPPGDLNISNYYNSSIGQGRITNSVLLWYPIPEKKDTIANFSAWCWTTQVFQADFYAAQIQHYRRGSGLPQRTLGSLYWQLEDQWAAPTWSGIERSGRWKVLHYRAKDLYRNVIISPVYNSSTNFLEIAVSSDLWSDVQGTVNAEWYHWDGSRLSDHKAIDAQPVSIGALNSTRVYAANITNEFGITALTDAVLRMNVTVIGSLPNSNESLKFHHTNWFHASPLSKANIVDPGLKLSHDNSTKTFTITATQGISAWTWLDYQHGAVVVFEDNGFWIGKGESKVVGYNVTSDDTGGRWLDGVTISSLWNNTLSV